MPTAAISGNKPNFNANIYDHMNEPIARNLFSTCEPALKLVESFINRGESASAILSNLKFKFYGISNHQSLEDPSKENRYLFLLAKDYISQNGVQRHIDEYTTEPSSWFSTLYNGLMCLKNFKCSNPKIVDCTKPGSKQGRENYVFCEEAKAQAAEILTDSIKNECSLQGASLIFSKHLENMGEFIKAAENKELGLSIIPNKIRQNWEDNFKFEYCTQNPLDEVYCANTFLEFPSNSTDYIARILSHISMPEKIKQELTLSVFENTSLGDEKKTEL